MSELKIVGDPGYKRGPCLYCGDGPGAAPRTSEADHTSPECPWFKRNAKRQALRSMGQRQGHNPDKKKED